MDAAEGEREHRVKDDSGREGRSAMDQSRPNLLYLSQHRRPVIRVDHYYPPTAGHGRTNPNEVHLVSSLAAVSHQLHGNTRMRTRYAPCRLRAAAIIEPPR